MIAHTHDSSEFPLSYPIPFHSSYTHASPSHLVCRSDYRLRIHILLSLTDRACHIICPTPPLFPSSPSRSPTRHVHVLAIRRTLHDLPYIHIHLCIIIFLSHICFLVSNSSVSRYVRLLLSPCQHDKIRRNKTRERKRTED